MLETRSWPHEGFPQISLCDLCVIFPFHLIMATWRLSLYSAQKELHECVQHIQDPAVLRQLVTTIYKANVSADIPRSETDANVIHEYHRHKVKGRYLKYHELYLIYECSKDVDSSERDCLGSLPLDLVSCRREHSLGASGWPHPGAVCYQSYIYSNAVHPAEITLIDAWLNKRGCQLLIPWLNAGKLTTRRRWTRRTNVWIG